MGAAVMASPAFWSAVTAAGGALASTLAAPEGQELDSFEGEGIADPTHLLQGLVKSLATYGNSAVDLANQPISMPLAFAQTPPGLSGVDPAFGDRSLLTRPGANLPDLFSHFLDRNAPGSGGGGVDPDAPGGGNAPPSSFGGEAPPRGDGPVRHNANKPSPQDRRDIREDRRIARRTPPQVAPQTAPPYVAPDDIVRMPDIPEHTFAAKISSMLGREAPPPADDTAQAEAAVEMLLNAGRNRRVA